MRGKKYSMIQIVLIGLGGFFGAISRFGFSRKIQLKSGFPAATLIVNLLGAFLLGFFAGLQLTGQIYAFAGIGFMGAFTTFSTFKLDAIKLKYAKKRIFFYIYLAVSYIGGITLSFIGLLIGRAL